MKQDRNIHIISTDYLSRLKRNNQNIYITNDEEIKEGDWYIDDANQIRKSITSDKQYWAVRQDYKKIILTTDQDLIKDGVQAIDDEFLEWFVKNPSCEEVDVKMQNYYASGALQPNLWKPKIIIPKEEPKQETLEELAERLKGKELFKESNDRARETLSEIKSLPKQETLEEREPYWDLVDKKAEQNNTIDLDAYAKGVQDGAKWQQKQDKKLYNEVFEWLANKDYLSDKVEPIQKEFEQFKKK